MITEVRAEYDGEPYTYRLTEMSCPHCHKLDVVWHDTHMDQHICGFCGYEWSYGEINPENHGLLVTALAAFNRKVSAP